jgi:hypothetical protein
VQKKKATLENDTEVYDLEKFRDLSQWERGPVGLEKFQFPGEEMWALRKFRPLSIGERYRT